MVYLTVEQHQEVVRRLLALARNRANKIPFHPEGMEYHSLMVCFLLHNLSVAETLLRLSDSFGKEWFPVTVGYAITRTMFETDVTAHYISNAAAERARQYIDFSAVLNKRQMDACLKHRNSKEPSWREAMSMLWQNLGNLDNLKSPRSLMSLLLNSHAQPKMGNRLFSRTGPERSCGIWLSKLTMSKHTTSSTPNFHRSLMLTCILRIASFNIDSTGLFGLSERMNSILATSSDMRRLF